MAQPAQPTGRKHVLWRVCGMVFVGHVALNRAMQTTGETLIMMGILFIESLLVMQPNQLAMRNYGRLIEALSQALLKISPSWLRLRTSPSN